MKGGTTLSITGERKAKIAWNRHLHKQAGKRMRAAKAAKKTRKAQRRAS